MSTERYKVLLPSVWAKRRRKGESFLKNVAVDIRTQKKVHSKWKNSMSYKAWRRKCTWLFTEVQEYRNYWVLTEAIPAFLE